MEFVTLKAPKATFRKIGYLQRVLSFREGKQVFKSKVISKAIDLLEESFVSKSVKKSNIMDICGIAKGGGPSNAAIDVDEVVYGDPHGLNRR